MTIKINLDLFLITVFLYLIWRSVRHTEKTLEKFKIDALKKPRASSVDFFTLKNGLLERVVSMFMKVDAPETLVCRPTDSKGNTATIDGVPKWALTPPELATLEISEDGLQCKVVPAGPLGAAKLQVLGDADMGEGVKEVLGERDIEFIAGDAVGFEISVAPKEPIQE